VQPTDQPRPFADRQDPQACAAVARCGRFWTPVSVAVIVAAALAAYANSFYGAFVYDDIGFFTKMDWLLRPEALWKGLPFSTDVYNRSLTINYLLGGSDPWGYHAVNLAVHVAAALVLLGIVRRTLLSDRLRRHFGRDAAPLALAVALLWAVHPLQTESVTYVIQRRESMMGLFFLLTLYAVLRATASHRRLAWYAAALLFCRLGMDIKHVMIAAPAIALAYDRTFLAGSWREALKRRGILYALMAATWLTVMRSGVARLQTSGMGVPELSMSTWDYARSQLGVVAHYLRLSVWPSPLCLDYGWPVARAWDDVLLPAALIAALLALTAWAFWRRPVWGFLGVWFFVILAPTSSFVTITFLAFEHRMYLSLAAVVATAVLAGYLLGQRALARLAASERTRTVIGWSLAAALVAGTTAALGYTTARRNDDYRSEISIWEDTARKRPDNPLAHGNLGMALLKAGDADRAVEQLNITLQLGGTTAETFFNRGSAYQKKSDLDRAILDYNRAIQLKPDYAEAYANRGAAWQTKGRNDQALSDLTKAVELGPNLADAWYNRGNAFVASGDLDRAFQDYSRTIDLAPAMAEAWNNRGVVRLARGNFGEAVLDFTRAIELAPDFGPAYRNRAACFIATKAPDKAWADVNTCKKLGYAVDEALLKELATASPPPAGSP
jgi:tetratricopeptide (TPR) repeat protein